MNAKTVKLLRRSSRSLAVIHAAANPSFKQLNRTAQRRAMASISNKVYNSLKLKWKGTPWNERAALRRNLQHGHEQTMAALVRGSRG